MSETSKFSENWKIVGARADCAAECDNLDAHTDFQCEGFLSAASGDEPGECILFGQVTGEIVLHERSAYVMYERLASGGTNHIL